MLAKVARGGGAGGVSFSLPSDWMTGPCVGDGIASMRRGRISMVRGSRTTAREDGAIYVC
eukprot:scaffold61646_cov62-Phaeocystis_antarctica.AAC.4